MIFEFSNYVSFLRSYISQMPKKGRGEIKRMSEHLGVNSTLMSQVFSGNKVLTIEQAHKLAGYLGLSDMESDGFIFMVQQERAGTQDLKKYWENKIEKLRIKSLNLSERLPKDSLLSEKDEMKFYSSWHYSAVRMVSSLEKYKTVNEMARYFNVSRLKMREVIDFLVETGLCKETNEGISIGPSRTHLSKNSPSILNHHTNWRIKALEKVTSLTDEELMFTAPMSVSKKDYLAIREELAQLISRISDRAKESNAEMVTCIGIDWIHIPPFEDKESF